ncbi:hypothetical protein RJ639_034313 [Escallonia herrerae]|uniref:Uncharacterized protein n=1 Tax=Escallonia herrerae TaxID=1293975 RepID=A0AA88WU46_9ASTE|nr:hypothetical protein RJ639_034313 [Escallonia herrerae]
MDQDEKRESTSVPMPVLPRLDRLDRLLQLMEEKHSLSGRHSSKPAVANLVEEVHSKTLSSALEEVDHKGTLMERLATLENRVFQLGLDMDEGNTSRSSSSTALVFEKSGYGSGTSSVLRQDKDQKAAEPPPIQVCIDKRLVF